MTEVKERIFPNIASFGDPWSFFNFIREQHRKPNPLIRVILLCKLSDFEEYPLMVREKGEIERNGKS